MTTDTTPGAGSGVTSVFEPELALTFDDVLLLPAASEVMSLFCPIAIPTVAAVSAGASFMPSPTNTVLDRRVS